jgi:hypothetical protein
MIRLRVQSLVLLLMKLEIKKKKEQMAITLHFIDKNGFIGEHFFHAVHIKDIMTDSKTKKCAMFYLVMIFL